MYSSHVMNTYCFITSTFILPRHLEGPVGVGKIGNKNKGRGNALVRLEKAMVYGVHCAKLGSMVYTVQRKGLWCTLCKARVHGVHCADR